MKTFAPFRLISAASLMSLLAAYAAPAQERCKFSYGWGNEGTTVPQQLSLDVGDIPGHTIAIFEIHHGPNPSAKPNCEGFKIAEVLGQGFSDSIERNGRAWGYDTITLDNGDKIYTEWSGTRIAVTGADGSLRTTFSGTTSWTGGTGRYLGVRGFSRDKAETLYVRDSQGKLKATTNNGLKEVEYWFEK
jgi:hypothetical protein